VTDLHTALTAAIVEVEEAKTRPCLMETCGHPEDDPRCMSSSIGCGDATAILATEAMQDVPQDLTARRQLAKVDEAIGWPDGLHGRVELLTEQARLAAIGAAVESLPADVHIFITDTGAVVWGKDIPVVTAPTLVEALEQADHD